MVEGCYGMLLWCDRYVATETATACCYGMPWYAAMVSCYGIWGYQLMRCTGMLRHATGRCDGMLLRHAMSQELYAARNEMYAATACYGKLLRRNRASSYTPKSNARNRKLSTIRPRNAVSCIWFSIVPGTSWPSRCRASTSAAHAPLQTCSPESNGSKHCLKCSKRIDGLRQNTPIDSNRHNDPLHRRVF
eukprot:1255303-Rhodomonas_salina.1